MQGKGAAEHPVAIHTFESLSRGLFDQVIQRDDGEGKVAVKLEVIAQRWPNCWYMTFLRDRRRSRGKADTNLLDNLRVPRRDLESPPLRTFGRVALLADADGTASKLITITRS